MDVTARTLAEYLADTCQVHVVNGERLAEAVTGPAPLDAATTGHVTFIRGRDETAALRLRECRAAVVIAQEPASRGTPVTAAAVVAYAANPRLQLIRVIERFFFERLKTGIDPSAVISPQATVGDDVRIGDGAIVGAATVGRGTSIGPGARIADGVTIGENCSIAAGAVLGSDGFGYERDETGIPQKFPQLGGVRIGDRVDVGANACIDRGALSDTVIGNDVKIDNLVHIAHNVVIGEGTMIAASAVVAGSTRVGANVWIGPSACISDGLVIGESALVSLGAVVTRDVAPGMRVTGNFAIPHDQFLRALRRDR